MIRSSLRRLYMGLATLTGLSSRGFFIPYRYAAGVAPTNRDAFSALAARLAKSEPNLVQTLNLMDNYADALMAIGTSPPPSPRWKQDWFPGLDGAAAYSIIRAFKPARVVEVGSGHSTRFLAQAVRDEGLQTSITAIDPAPRADLEGLGVTCIRNTVQTVDFGPFKALQPGDVLSVDSSHILMPGTDVDILFNRVIPVLPPGVIIHIHDIFLPDGYPDDWAWRGYNEQLAVAAMLDGSSSELLWASHYARTRMNNAVRGSVAARIEVPAGARESSLWFRKG
jgi:hypothetical protein